MSQPPSNPNNQSQSPQSRIDQQSHGDHQGGQQAAIGDNNVQVQYDIHVHPPYNELRDEDLKPLTLKGKFLSYFGVFIILVLTLIFWFFFGLFIHFPFPFHEAIELFGSCFQGNVGSELNRLQKQLQSKNTDSLSIDELNRIEFQSRLYLEILECLGSDTVENPERLAKTIEALKQKRVVLQNEIKPRQRKKYQTVTKAQDFFESFVLSQNKEDLMEIEAVLANVTSFVSNSYPSEDMVKNASGKLSREITRKAKKISPAKLGLLYRTQALLDEISRQQISNFKESDLQNLNKKIIRELQEEKNLLTKELQKLSNEKNSEQQALQKYLREISRLNGLVEEREADLSNLRGRINDYAITDRDQRNTISALSSDLERVEGELRDLQVQKTQLSKDVTQLRRTLQQKQDEIDELKKQINQYSGMRVLNGKYVGNVKDKTSKYHFHEGCSYWKMLVGEYVLGLGLDRSRKVKSSDSADLFLEEGLKKCDKCDAQCSDHQSN